MAEENITEVGVRSRDQATLTDDVTSSQYDSDLKTLSDKFISLAILDKESLAKLRLAPSAGSQTVVLEMERLGLMTPFQAGFVRSGEIEKLRMDEYLLLDKIGEGGMGEVFRAKNLSLDRIEAIKVIRSADSSPMAARRFQQEARLLARLEHPGIVPVYRIGRHDDADFIAMKFVEGETLKDKMVAAEAGNAAFSAGHTCRWMIEAAEALGHAHRQGIIHRDVKPGNLMINPEGKVVVLDLGIAQLRDPNRSGGTSSNRLTQQIRGMGTPEFMPPEQWADARCVTPESDVYSLACTFFWVLTGRPAYAGDQIVDLMRAHTTAPVPRPSAFRGDLPSGLDAVFMRAMAKHPKDRFATMTDLVEALMPFAFEKQIVRTGSSGAMNLTDSLNSATELINGPNVSIQKETLDNVWKKPTGEKKGSPIATIVMSSGCVAALWFAAKLFSPQEPTRSPAVVSSGNFVRESTNPKGIGDSSKQKLSSNSDDELAKKSIVASPSTALVKASESGAAKSNEAALAAPPTSSGRSPAPPPGETSPKIEYEPFGHIRAEALMDDWSKLAIETIRTVLGANHFPTRKAPDFQIHFVDKDGKVAIQARAGETVFPAVKTGIDCYLCCVRFDGRDLAILPYSSRLSADTSKTLENGMTFAEPGKKRFVFYFTNVPLATEPVHPDNAAESTFARIFDDPKGATIIAKSLEDGFKLKQTTPPPGLEFSNRFVVDLEVVP